MLSAALTASRNRAWTVKPRIVADFQIMSVMLTSAFQVDRASDLWRSHALSVLSGRRCGQATGMGARRLIAAKGFVRSPVWVSGGKLALRPSLRMRPEDPTVAANGRLGNIGRVSGRQHRNRTSPCIRCVSPALAMPIGLISHRRLRPRTASTRSEPDAPFRCFEWSSDELTNCLIQSRNARPDGSSPSIVRARN